jgi:DNA topoisomerase VI subunit A
VEKVFDFSSISYRLKLQKEMALTLKSICMLTRLLEIVEVSLELLQKGQIITKRNLYYKLINYYDHKYGQVDSDLDILCSNMDLTR